MAAEPLYGIANGNGPLHVMRSTEGVPVAACGRKRARAYPSIAYQVGSRPVCGECTAVVAREERESARLAAAAIHVQLEAELAKVVEATATARAARTKVREGLTRALALVCQAKGSVDLAERDVLMVAAREAGMTLQEVADIFGVTRQAVQQRLSRRAISPQPVDREEIAVD